MNNCWSALRLLSNLLIMLSLQGCSHYIYQEMRYPASETNDQQLYVSPPTVDLSHYQSIQNEAHRPWQRGDVAIAVAASGGGYRAANLTAGFMIAMEHFRHPQLHGNLLSEVDYFSTVSGSGFAVGAYIAGLHDYLIAHPNVRTLDGFHYENTLGLNYNKDPLGVNRQGPLDKPFTNQLFWWYLFGKPYRGNLFQDQVDNFVLGKARRGRSLLYGDIYVSRDDKRRFAKVPYWIPNTTDFQNIQRVPLTPDVIAAYKLNGYEHYNRFVDLRGQYRQFDYGFDVPLALGLRSSASYPLALPPATFKSSACKSSKCYMHLVDGGLSENTGILTALDILLQDKAPIKILIVVDAFSGSIEPFSLWHIEPSLFATLRHIYEAIGDSRNEIRNKLPSLAKATLCRQGTKNVLILYYDLDKRTQARMMGTKLDISREEQVYLLRTGVELFHENKVQLQKLKQLLQSGQLDVSTHC